MRTAVLFLTVLCACSTYSRRQAALVPVLAPPLRSGQPLASAGEFSLGSGKVVSAGAPVEASGGNAGVWTPVVDLNGAMRLRVGQNFDVGFVFDGGPNDGAQSVTDSQPRPDGAVWGGGLSLGFSAPLSPELRLGLASDLLIYTVPWVEYDTCATNCGGVSYSIVSRENKSATVFSLALIPSWHHDRFTVFGGLTLRNHPTTPLGGTTVIPGEGGVDGGPAYLIASAGIEVAIGGEVKAMAMIYQPLMSDPVTYYPTVALALSVGFGSSPAPQPQPQPPPPPPPSYYSSR